MRASRAWDVGLEKLRERETFRCRYRSVRLCREHTTFVSEHDGTRVTTTFDPASRNPVEMQRDGWQAILDSYAAYVDVRGELITRKGRSQQTSRD